MILVNEMFEEPNNHVCYLGVCIKKAYRYYEYIQTTSGCACSENFVGEIVKYLNSGLYVESFQNTNPNYQIDHEDSLICLVIDIPIVDWVESYINSIATSGYTGSTTSELEDRVIFDNSGGPNTGLYFKLVNSISSGCTIDTTPMWAIIDNSTGEIWKSGDTDYWYYELDTCGNNTCNRIVLSKDINPNSETYGQSTSIYRCGGLPTVETLPISGETTTITTGGNVISDGNSEILSRGICWNTYGETPTITDNVNLELGTVGEFISTITGITQDKIYHIRAFATNCFGTSYGAELVFTSTVICDCPSGYTYDPITDLCKSIEPATNSGTVFTAKHYQYFRYISKGMIFYKPGNYNVDGTWDITKTDLLPDAHIITANQADLINANNFYTTNELWVNPLQLSGVTNGRLNTTGVWVEANQSEEGVFGFTQGFTVPTDDIYYVGFGSDNTGKIEIDGITIVDQNITNMAASDYFNVPSIDEDRIPFWYWFIYPVQLTAGITHNITISANNTGVLGILGCEIYNASEAELVACTTNSGSGVTSLSQYIVFSTAPKGTFAEKPLIGVNDGDQFQLGNWTCPEGYQLTYNGSYFCEKTSPIECP